MPGKPHILRFVLGGPVQDCGPIFLMGERSYFDCDKDQSTWDWSLIIGRECWWDPEAQRLHLNTYCTHGFESELLEDHGYDPQSFPEVYITYGMNSWEDVGGSDLWVRDYLSEDPDLFAVYHAPNLKLRKQLDTPKDTWTYMGNFRNSEMLNKTIRKRRHRRSFQGD